MIWHIHTHYDSARTTTHTDKHPELGHLLWTLDGHYVVGLAFSQEAPPARIDYDDAESDEPQPLPGYPAGLDAINAFLAGDEWALRRLPHRLSGTPFQFAVWQTVASIQRGTTMSYGEIAQELKRPKAARAVGRPWGKTRCHSSTRVTASSAANII